MRVFISLVFNNKGPGSLSWTYEIWTRIRA